MPYYGFRLDEIYCIYQRGKKMDSDVVMLAAAVNEQRAGGIAGRFNLSSGARVPAGDVPPDIPGKFGRNLGGWIVGPFYATDGDFITVTCVGVNKSDTPEGADQAFARQAELPALDALIGAAAGAATGGLAALGDLAAAAASAGSAVLGKVGKVAETLLGYSQPPQCDGVAFQWAQSFPGAELARLAYSDNPVGFGQFAITTHTDDSAAHPPECGHVAETDLTLSVLSFGDSLSFRTLGVYFWPGVDFAKGLRQLATPGQTTSLRTLLCS